MLSFMNIVVMLENRGSVGLLHASASGANIVDGSYGAK